MNVLIVDDEPKARNLLKKILQENCDYVQTIFEASNLEQGVKSIKENRPKIVFLDIEMPNEQGLEILNYFEKEEIDFEIVFTTAYSQYALRAFEMNAIDYILKPIRPKRLLEVVEKVHTSYDQENITIKLEELRNSLRNNRFQKIGLPVNNGVLFLPLDDVVHLEADGMYTKFYTMKNGQQIVSKPLKFFEHILESGLGFYRPHRSHIFNIHYLKQYVKKDGNYVVLENDHIVPIAKDKREEFINLISAL